MLVLLVIKPIYYGLPLIFELSLPFPLATFTLFAYFTPAFLSLILQSHHILLSFFIKKPPSLIAGATLDGTNLFSRIGFGLKRTVKFGVDIFFVKSICIFGSISGALHWLVEIMKACWCWMMAMVIWGRIEGIAVLMLFSLLVHLIKTCLFFRNRLHRHLVSLLPLWFVDELVNFQRYLLTHQLTININY